MVSIWLASILCWVSGIGFGVFCPPAIRNLLTGRDVPIVMGFRAYGGGYFERIGLQTTVPLLAAFLLVCIFRGYRWLAVLGRAQERRCPRSKHCCLSARSSGGVSPYRLARYSPSPAPCSSSPAGRASARQHVEALGP